MDAPQPTANIGKPCVFINDVICQEGFCHGCVIYKQHHITAVERDCLQLTANGLSAKEVADHRGISEQTVKNHLADARHKLGAHSTIQAIIIGIRTGQIQA